MTEHVVTCRAPRKNAEVGVQCRGFVANMPGPSTVTRMLRHSSEKRSGMVVAACVVCGALHEIQCKALESPRPAA